MAEATDEQLLAAIGKLRLMRSAHLRALETKEAAERRYRSAQDAYTVSLEAVAEARQELDRLADGIGLSKWID